MRFSGKLMPPVTGYNGKTVISVELEEDFRPAWESLKGCEKVGIDIKQYRPKRSLDANAYYWTLVGKLAKVLGRSSAAIHNYMVSHYGIMEMIDDKLMYLSIPDTEAAQKIAEESETFHIRPTSQILTGKDGKQYRTYIQMRGSSYYNSAEMARLIEGLIQECKDAEIPESEIMTPDEKRILEERYGITWGK